MVKKNLIKVLALSTICCTAVGVGVHNTVQVKADEVAQQISWEMDYGASVYKGTEDIGIRYTAKMSKMDYNKLVDKYTEENLSYGMLIAPLDYVNVHELNASTVFGVGGTKYYDWAIWNGTEWVYTATDTNKDGIPDYNRIINLTADALTEDGDDMMYAGGIVGILPTNKTRAFVGLGYIAYTVNGETKYEFADWAKNENGDENSQSIANTTRSMAQVAQIALAKGDLEQTKANEYLNDVDYVVRTFVENGTTGKYTQTTENNADAITAWQADNKANVGEILEISELANGLKPNGTFLDTWKTECVVSNEISTAGRAYYDLYYTTEDTTDFTFERMSVVPSTIKATYNAEYATYSIAEVEKDGAMTKALKLVNNNGTPITTITFSDEFVAQMTMNKALKLKLLYYPTNNNNAQAFQVQIFDQQGGNRLIHDNNVLASGYWMEYILAGDALQKVVATKKIAVNLALYGATIKNWEMYIDDITLVDYYGMDGTFDSNNDSLSNGSTFKGIGGYGESNVAFSVTAEHIKGIYEKTLKVQNTTNSGPIVPFKFGDYANHVAVGDKLTFRMYINNNNCTATTYTLNIGTKGATWSYNLLSGYNISRDTAGSWHSFELTFTEEAVNNYKTNPYIYIYLNTNSASNQQWIYHLDDIQLVKA